METQSQTVLVTGGGRGIGWGIVEAFLSQGARVAIMDLDPRTPPDGPSNRLLPIKGDVARPEDARAAIDQVYAAWGRLDVLVNNAGIYPNRPMLEMDYDQWKRVYAVDVDGTFLMSQAYARRLVDAGTHGCIVNISSGAAISGRVGASHYCSAKAAVEMFTKVLAMELASYGVRVNCIRPGLIDVRSPENPAPISEEYRRELIKTIPMNVAGQPRDIGEVAVFLASDSARYMTGSIVTVDGGSTAGRNQLPLS